MSVCASVLKGK